MLVPSGRRYLIQNGGPQLFSAYFGFATLVYQRTYAKPFNLACGLRPYFCSREQFFASVDLFEADIRSYRAYLPLSAVRMTCLPSEALADILNSPESARWTT